MAKDEAFLDYVLDQMRGVKALSARAMFGAHGLYAGETVFGVVDDGRVYLKVDDANRPDFEARGMGPFEYAPGKKLASYYEIPPDVLEAPDDLKEWTAKAVAAGKVAAKKKEAKKRK